MIPYTQLRSAPRIDIAKSIPLPAPLTLYIEPTNRCNLSCGFCPQSLDDYETKTGLRQDISMTLYRSLIEQAREIAPKSLKLYFFGEPLLHPEIGEIVRLATSVCERVELTTNGMALTRKIAQQLIDHELDYLRVSLYPEGRNVARNVAYLHSLRLAMKSAKPHICAKVFDQSELARYKPEFEFITDSIAVECLHTIGSDFVQISQQPTSSKVACPYPFYNLVIKSNGDVVPCCVAWEDSLIVGNAHAESLMDIWRGEKLARIHRLHLEGRRGELSACHSCDTIHNSPDDIDSRLL